MLKDTNMKTQVATLFIAACAVFTPASTAFSHDGHGLSGSHWHASDAWGFAALAVMVALAVWLGRGRK
jgi:hypothetical protein